MSMWRISLGFQERGTTLGTTNPGRGGNLVSVGDGLNQAQSETDSSIASTDLAYLTLNLDVMSLGVDLEDSALLLLIDQSDACRTTLNIILSSLSA